MVAMSNEYMSVFGQNVAIQGSSIISFRLKAATRVRIQLDQGLEILDIILA